MLKNYQCRYPNKYQTIENSSQSFPICHLWKYIKHNIEYARYKYKMFFVNIFVSDMTIIYQNTIFCQTDICLNYKNINFVTFLQATKSDSIIFQKH